MSYEIANERALLAKVNQACKILCWIMKIIFVVVCLWWVCSSAIMLWSPIKQDLPLSVGDVDVLGISLYLAGGVVVAGMLLALIKVFSEAAKGCSPFVMQQVGRLRFVSFMLVLYSIFDFAMSHNAAVLHFSNGVAAGSDAIATLSLAPLVAAAVIFAFSFVFKYGVLLQEFSDDTI